MSTAIRGSRISLINDNCIALLRAFGLLGNEYRAVSRDVTRTNYDVAQKSGHFGAHRKCMGQNRNFVKRER